ncbi:hypothetical protein EV361DRAFT_766797, partial [Lentinula raphanica]
KECISNFNIFNCITTKTLNLIEERALPKQAINIQDLLSQFTIDSAMEFLCRVELDTISHPLHEPGHVKLGARGSILVKEQNGFDDFIEAFE